MSVWTEDGVKYDVQPTQKCFKPAFIQLIYHLREQFPDEFTVSVFFDTA